MALMHVPGHDRDAADPFDTLEDLAREQLLHDNPALPSPFDTVGLWDARIQLDELAYAEWQATQDEYQPTRVDRAVARMAAAG